jgi:membrane protein DedA with SNARE-associated domain
MLGVAAMQLFITLLLNLGNVLPSNILLAAVGFPISPQKFNYPEVQL